MQLEFFGAAGEVTGSCLILRVGGATLLPDCGLIPMRPTARSGCRPAAACGRLPLLTNLKLCRTTEESMAINRIRHGAIGNPADVRG